jgi:hypothetical protein
MAVLAYFSYGISLEKLRYYDIGNLADMVFSILDSKTAVIDKICLRYYGIEYTQCPPPEGKLHILYVMWALQVLFYLVSILP